MTSVPHSQRVIDHVALILRGITRANGYRTDTGLAVLDDEAEFVVEGPGLGAGRTFLLDLSTTARQAHEYTLTLTVQGQVYADPRSVVTPRQLAREWAQDVQEALGAADLMDYPVGIEAIRFTGLEIPQREAQDNYMLPALTYDIDYSNRAAL